MLKLFRPNLHIFGKFSKINKFIFNKTSNVNTAINISPNVQRKVGLWLLGMSGLTAGAVVIGGLTRLTESGLSMTNWHIFKERPPLNNEEWLKEFDNYKNYPEYAYVMKEKGEMTLERFKFIWWMEYSHRMCGRLIGGVFVITASYFNWKGYLDRRMKKRVLIFGGLILFQGLLGWYMVKSGLIPPKNSESDSSSVPRVSQYRLAAHLGSAIVLYSLFYWNAISHLIKPLDVVQTPQIKMVRGIVHGLKFFIFTTIMSGAFVAGLDAGLTYNSWPKMADSWIPSDLWALSPVWINIFENPTTVQFNHRHLGEFTGLWALGLSTLCIIYRSKLPMNITGLALLTGLLTVNQILLGIETLKKYVPTDLASAHQIHALLTLTSALTMSNLLRRVPK